MGAPANIKQPWLVRLFESVGIVTIAADLTLGGNDIWFKVLWMPFALWVLLAVSRRGQPWARWVLSGLIIGGSLLQVWVLGSGRVLLSQLSAFELIRLVGLNLLAFCQLGLLWTRTMSDWIAGKIASSRAKGFSSNEAMPDQTLSARRP